MFHWLSTNHLVANAGKCHLLTNSKTPVDIHISNTEILNGEIILEGRLNFDFHVNALFKKASERYHALARVCNYMNEKKRHILTNAFITSQFSYFRLVWLSHSRTMNKRINKIHENFFKTSQKIKQISLLMIY